MPKQLDPSASHLERKQTFQTETRTQSADQTTLQGLKNEENAGHHTFVMTFCPKCEALLELVHGKSSEMYCRKCKYCAKVQQMRVREKRIKPSNIIPKEIAVLDLKNSLLRTFPAVHAICPECNNDTSETWTMAIGSEGTTGVTFLRCTACGHTRREAE